MGVLGIGAALFEVYVRAPDFRKLPFQVSDTSGTIILVILLPGTPTPANWQNWPACR